MVIASGEIAKRACKNPVWITGFAHIAEPQELGVRDLTRSRSTEIAAERAGVAKGRIDVAEIYGPFTHQELLIERALGLGSDVKVNPSGGALAANPIMAAGLTRIGEAARAISEGGARRAVAHATSGPCLQQNLVCVLEG
jgi:acetyl-CoA acetyltransferase